MAWPVGDVVWSHERDNMARAELDIYTQTVDGVTVVTLVGPVDSATFNQYKEALDRLCRTESAPLLAIDCRQLSYVNSKGIGLLASLHRQVMIQMGNIALFGLSPRILKTLELLGLGKRLRIYETQEEALASFLPADNDAPGA